MTENETENTTEDNDYQERYSLYKEIYKEDSNLIAVNSSDFNNAIRYFTATLLIILFTGIDSDASNTSLFKTVFILCVVTIVSNLLAYPFTQYSVRIHRDVYADLYCLQDDRSYRFKKHWTYYFSFTFEVTSTVLFICVAIILTYGFLTANIIIKGVSP